MPILARLARPLRRGEVEELRGLTIEEPLVLERGALPHVDFSGTTFNAPLVLRGCTFQGLAWFTGCTFNAPAEFSEVRFESDARLDRVRFRRTATFSGAQFHGVACFDRTEFGGAAFLDRMTCYGNLSLDRTRFDAASTEARWRRRSSGERIHGTLPSACSAAALVRPCPGRQR